MHLIKQVWCAAQTNALLEKLLDAKVAILPGGGFRAVDHGAGGASVDVRARRTGDRRRARVGGAATTSARAVPGIGRARDSSALSQGYHLIPSASSV